MGLRVGVLVNKYNTSRYSEYTITNIEGPFDPSDDAPAAILNPGPLGTINIVPVWAAEMDGAGPMFNGNFAYSHDSRFGEAVANLMGRGTSHMAVAIHDRVESWEAYDLLSR